MNSSRSIGIAVFFLIGLGWYWFFGGEGHQAIDFNGQIKPLLNKHCIACHGGVKQSGGLSMMTRADLLKGGDSGKPAIIPGDAEESPFYQRLISDDPTERMPFEGEALPPDIIRLLKQWIDEGAKWEKHWAYLPVENPDLPTGALENTSSVAATSHGIDVLILNKLKEIGLDSSTTADDRTRLRRAALDIVGLPPTQSAKTQFLTGSWTYEELVDSLLASPTYGERWAAVWMDLARYADTKGSERDTKRDIWDYRDWLIRAFNQDMPYDQFLTEQIAGDLLPNPTDAQYIATGFHRNTITNDEGGSDNDEYRAAAVADRVNTTFEAIMGTTFACTQCHGHPYDAFSHEEYYEFMAFFNDTRDHDTYDDYPWLRKYTPAQQRTLDQLTNWLDGQTSPQHVSAIKTFLKTWQPIYYSLTTDSLKNAAIYDTKFLHLRNNAIARLKQIDLTDKSYLMLRYKSFLPKGRLKIHVGSPDGLLIMDWDVPHTKGKWTMEGYDIKPFAGKVDLFITYENELLTSPTDAGIGFDWFHFAEPFPGEKDPQYQHFQNLFWELLRAPMPHTLIMMDNPGNMHRPTKVWDRGNWMVETALVEPDVPDIFPSMAPDAPKNRMGLAHWLTSDQHPLTARTMVNRVWEQLFGSGLVETLEDFGSQGASPTNQQLLDFLAWQFVHSMDWSIKKLVKSIVLSHTYQQKSVATAEQIEKDPNNKYLSRAPRVRLPAEQVRDQILAVSGLLSDKMYGKSVMPYQPPNVWNTPYNNDKWVISEGEDRYRRSLYTFWKRTAPHPGMLTFDAAERNVCVARRIRTNTPLQALVTLNDPSFMDAAANLAQLAQEQTSEVMPQIAFAYEQAIGHPISDEELVVFHRLFEEMKLDYSSMPEDINRLLKVLPESHHHAAMAALTMVCHSIMNLDAFLVKD